MALIGRLLGKLMARGRLTLIMPDGSRDTYGPGGSDEHLTVRFTDNRVGFDIVRNPRLGFGEAYMDGRVIIEDGSILDLLEMLLGANRWEDGGQRRKAIRTGRVATIRSLFRRNPATRSRRNVAHHYDLSDELYRLFLDGDRQALPLRERLLIRRNEVH